MSKLLNKYNEFKSKNPNIIYLFRVGIFYNVFNSDADFLNKEIGLKITSLSPNLYKVGFPISNLEKYKKIFESKNIKYSVIDNLPDNTTTQEYLNNIEIKKIINSIIELDINNITMQQAFNLLYDVQNKFRTILKGKE
jgi:DNA mismatch repair ATPase MutS